MPKNLKEAVTAFHEYFAALCSQIDLKFKNIKVKIEAFTKSLNELQQILKNFQEPEICAKFAALVEEFIGWLSYIKKDLKDGCMSVDEITQLKEKEDEITQLKECENNFTKFLVELIKINNPTEIIHDVSILGLWEVFFKQIALQKKKDLLVMNAQNLCNGFFQILKKYNIPLEDTTYEGRINIRWISYISANIKTYNDTLGHFFKYVCEFYKLHKTQDQTNTNIAIGNELLKLGALSEATVTIDAISRIFSEDKENVIQQVSSLLVIVRAIDQAVSFFSIPGPDGPNIKEQIKKAMHEGLTAIIKHYFPVNPDTLFFLRRSSRRTCPVAAEAKDEKETPSEAQTSLSMSSNSDFI